MDKNRQNLLNWARLVLVFAICDAINLVLNVINEYSEYRSVVDYPDQLVRTVTLAIIGVTLVLGALMVAVQIFAGVRGLREAENPTNATGYIRAAKVLAWVNVVLFVVAALGLIGAAITWHDVISVLIIACDAYILFSFVRSAKQIHQMI